MDIASVFTVRRDDVSSITSFLLKLGAVVMLYGPPGTGKSSVKRDVEQQLSREVFSIQCNESTEAQEVMATALPWEGRWTVILGQIIRAMQTGGIVWFDDFHAAGSGLHSAFRLAADMGKGMEFLLPNPTGEKIVPKPGYGVVCTTNGAWRVEDGLAPEIADRIRHPIPVYTPSTVMLDALLPEFRTICQRDYESAALRGEDPKTTYREYESMTKVVNAGASIDQALLWTIGPERGAKLLTGLATKLHHAGAIAAVDRLSKGLNSGAPGSQGSVSDAAQAANTIPPVGGDDVPF